LPNMHIDDIASGLAADVRPARPHPTIRLHWKAPSRGALVSRPPRLRMRLCLARGCG
jgi:hypothetical protein